jgi:hypothetical protein
MKRFGLRRQPAGAKRSKDWSEATTALSQGMVRRKVKSGVS